jgi:hypothetical protein
MFAPVMKPASSEARNSAGECDVPGADHAPHRLAGEQDVVAGIGIGCGGDVVVRHRRIDDRRRDGVDADVERREPIARARVTATMPPLEAV